MKISVIIPHINREEHLQWCLKGLEQQKYPKGDFEVIVVGELPESLKNNYTINLREIPYKFNQGEKFSPALLRNLGFKNATGDILAFLDCDMIVSKDYLMNMNNILSQDDVLVFSLRRKLTKDVTLSSIDQLRCVKYDRDEREEACRLFAYKYEDLKSICLWSYSHTMGMRRLTFGKVGGFYEKFTGWGLEDTEFSYRFYKAGIPIICDTKSRCYHIWHNEDFDVIRYKQSQENIEIFQGVHNDKMLDALNVYRKRAGACMKLYQHDLDPAAWMLGFIETYVRGYQAGLEDKDIK